MDRTDLSQPIEDPSHRSPDALNLALSSCLVSCASIALLALFCLLPAPRASAQETHEPDPHSGHAHVEKIHAQAEKEHAEHAHAEHAHAEKEHAEHAHAGHAGGDLHSPGFRHRFEDAERWAEIFDAPERADWQRPDEVVRLMGVEPGMTVADLGAGTGFFLGPLAKAVGPSGRVVGLDVEAEMVAHMTRRAEGEGWTQVEARTVATDDPGLARGSVDRVLIVNTWHHIDDRPAYGAKLAASLRPGGALYVVDYTLDSEQGPPKAHRLPPERVVRELEAAGFAARIVEETLPRQYVVEARLRP